ncbi:hypothetical protein [Ureibacillus thermosphaericus]|uniref:hypothetical protein n=1 Tax=Ureibacillus thermosphaericus TaxID=51173 RepID=UPI0030C97C8F
MNLHKTWTASVRRTIETYSNDCDAFYGENIFYSGSAKVTGSNSVFSIFIKP